MTRVQPPTLAHLSRLTDELGISEHAKESFPRTPRMYCTDDAGRLLAVASLHSGDPDARRLASIAISFLVRAQELSGRFRLRMTGDGHWTDDPHSDDADGRALYGLGVAAATSPWSDVRDTARMMFRRAGDLRSRYSRATAHAALGAVAILAEHPDDEVAGRMLADAATSMPRPNHGDQWLWPEPRLTYGNALLAEALIAIGQVTADEEVLDDGLVMLTWLAERETMGDRFSFTPVAGRGPGEFGPSFDQQPIEAWTMADACLRAFAVTRDSTWARYVAQAAEWFLGRNDLGATMFDAETGGSYDGLHARGVNLNQGAESTLAYVGTMMQFAQVHGELESLPSTRKAR